MRVLTATFKPPLILRYTYELQAEPKFFWIVVSKAIVMAEPEHSTDYSPEHNIRILYATMFICRNTALKNANSADFRPFSNYSIPTAHSYRVRRDFQRTS